MRPRDVVRGLETTGFKPRPGRTTLETRVYNELWRMAKRDGVRKRGGKYALEEKHESGPR
jgi:hypothetical protein